MCDVNDHLALCTKTLALTNDLNEREDQIIVLKKREAALEENLKMKEKMYAQDAQVRLQLGKRLEQVLMDKEEIKDELDSLKVVLCIDFRRIIFQRSITLFRHTWISYATVSRMRMLESKTRVSALCIAGLRYYFIS